MFVVINTAIGWYLPSPELIEQYQLRSGIIDETFNHTKIVRHDPLLVELVKELGSAACDARYCEFKIVQIPDGISYDIVNDGYGVESIHETHRIWF